MTGIQGNDIYNQFRENSKKQQIKNNPSLQVKKERQEENEKEWVQSLQPMKINR